MLGVWALRPNGASTSFLAPPREWFSFDQAFSPCHLLPPFIRTKSDQVCDTARLVGVRVVEVVEVTVVVAFLFCRSLQASPCEGAEGVDGFLPGLEPAFCYRTHFLAPEFDSFGLQGFFALLIPLLKQVVTE